MTQTTAGDGDSEVRSYWGGSEAEASASFQRDVINLAAQGYRPTSQVWIGPSSRVRIVLTPLILVIAAQLIFGLYGAALAAIFGAVYILWEWAHPRGRLNVTLLHEDSPPD